MKNKVKELREVKKMTQKQLAAELNVSRQAINAIENEKFDPSIILAFKIAKFFSCKIEDVFKFEGDINE